MKESEPGYLVHILIGVALLLGAAIIAYPFLFVDEPTAVVVLTDGSSGIGEIPEEFLVNINTATEAEFQELPGVGPVLAKRIVEYRQQNGGFERLDDLKNVAGIGDKTFEKFQDQITLGEDVS